MSNQQKVEIKYNDDYHIIGIGDASLVYDIMLTSDEEYLKETMNQLRIKPIWDCKTGYVVSLLAVISSIFGKQPILVTTESDSFYLYSTFKKQDTHWVDIVLHKIR